MKKFNKKIIVSVLAIALVFGFTGSNVVHAATATAPTLGSADSYSVFGAAGITNTGLGSLTNLWGNAGGNGVSTAGLLADQVDGTLYTIAQNIGIDITAAYGLLNAQTGATAKSLSGIVTVTPGLYTVIPAETLNGTVTLDGAGVYVFRSSGAFTVSTGGTMNLINGADACNVFWQIPTTMIIGSNARVEGTIITESSHITLGTGAVLKGRALAGGAGQVTLLSNQITQPICTAPVVRRSSSGSSPRITQPISTNPALLTIIKQVVNNGGSTATSSLFNLHVKNSGVDVLGSPNNGVAAPGIYYSLPVGTYVISEDANPSYVRTFSGDCDLNGSVTLSASQNKTCVVTNTHIFVPSLPKTGFPPQESSTWYESLLNNILNLFR